MVLIDTVGVMDIRFALCSIGTRWRNDYSLRMSILASNSDSVRAASDAQSSPAGQDQAWKQQTWQQQMKSAIRDLSSLGERLGIKVDPEKTAKPTAQFPVFVPLALLERMENGNANDPLLLQVLPVAQENQSPKHFSIDPLEESAATLQPGLLQKYQGRVLMIVTGACAVHCRYCFRRHFPYQQSPTSMAQWQSAIDEIAADESIEEVILSGGDPLTIVDEKLAELVAALDSIEHLKRLRIHTRLPIMIPARVTEGLVEMLSESRLQSFMVIHANHENELDDSVAEALDQLASAGVTLLNQSVLLRGINDDSEALIGLSKRLLQLRVLPYYLHQLDQVVGTSHFEVSPQRGIELIEAMRAALPGYAVPRFVKELPGEPNKTVWA